MGFFPIWIATFTGLLILTATVIWIAALIHALFNGKLSPGEKVVWTILILFFHLFGAVLYFALGGRLMKKSKGKKLHRSKNKMIAGVCAGIGEYLGVDPTVIRLLWVLFTFVSAGAGVLGYIAAWVIIPEK